MWNIGKTYVSDGPNKSQHMLLFPRIIDQANFDAHSQPAWEVEDGSSPWWHIISDLRSCEAGIEAATVAIYFNQLGCLGATGTHWEQTLARIIIRATLWSQWANYCCQPSLKATLQRGGKGKTQLFELSFIEIHLQSQVSFANIKGKSLQRMGNPINMRR